MREIGRRVGVLVLLGWMGGLWLPPAKAQNSTALRWRPWEQELIAATDYTVGGGNPYRDLALSVQYWRKPAGATACGAPVAGGDSFTSFGFWEGGRRTGSPPVWSPDSKRFLIRSMFPDGAWCWKTTCRRSLPDGSASSTLDCATDVGLNKSGQVTLSSPTTSNRLYALGLPMPSADKRSLVYGDGVTQLLWLGDTAWDAPIKYGNGTQWAGFVADRVGKDFRTVLVAPATQTSTDPPTQGFGTARTDCSAAENAVVPNRCSKWDGKYWEQFDELVVKANSTGKGMIVVVADVMDPTVRGGTNNQLNRMFPTVAEAKVFARNLAARLAGYFVVFSPSYDSKTLPMTAPNVSMDGKSVLQLIQAVGPVIKSAAPRHLVGVHLAGSNPLGDYLSLQNEAWLGLQMFQSGHGSSNAGAPCNFSSSGADFKRAVCRAREGALEFRCIRTAPTPGTPPTILPVCVNANGNSADRVGTPKPAVNVEGEYESAYIKQDQPNGTTVLVRTLGELPPSRARSRHTAWVTALSGSFGFNIGEYIDITAWSKPMVYSDLYVEGGQTNPFQADDDLRRMSKILGQSPWSSYVPWHTLVSENTVPAEEDKRHLGVTPSVVLVHVPKANLPATTVKLLKSGALANLSCAWTGTWTDPRGFGTFLDIPVKCDPVAGGFQFSVLAPSSLGCPPGEAPCDWILKLQAKTLAGPNAPNALVGKGTPPESDLKVWTEVDEDSLGVSVWAQLLGSTGDPTGDPFIVHPFDPRMRALPTVTRDAKSNFLVVWEEEGDDATDDVVHVSVSTDGIVLGKPAAVSSSTENQNGEPAVTSGADGSSIVTWTEYALDGSLGDIRMQIYSPTGVPRGDTLQVTNEAGNQSASQVEADGLGGVVVAWTSDPTPDDGSTADPRPAVSPGVYFRKLWTNGKPPTVEQRIQSHIEGLKGRDRLMDLEVSPNGEFKLVWETVNDDGSIEGLVEQDFDSQGNPVSEPRRAGN